MRVAAATRRIRAKRVSIYMKSRELWLCVSCCAYFSGWCCRARCVFSSSISKSVVGATGPRMLVLNAKDEAGLVSTPLKPESTHTRVMFSQNGSHTVAETCRSRAGGSRLFVRWCVSAGSAGTTSADAVNASLSRPPHLRVSLLQER